jgi:hypothetical protein
MAKELPADLLAAIKKSAIADWPGDKEMQAYIIDNETEHCRKYLDLDFGEASPFKEAIEESAFAWADSWEDRLNAVQAEIEAFAELKAPAPDDIPSDAYDKLRQEADDGDADFTGQLERLNQSITAFRYVRDTRSRIEPIRHLLVAMEGILGSECYNDNIQNYGPGGVWEGEGRSFRYPVTFLVNGEGEKRRSRTDDLPAEALLTGHYRFGANQLSVYRALVKILDMLERDHGLKLPKR